MAGLLLMLLCFCCVATALLAWQKAQVIRKQPQMKPQASGNGNGNMGMGMGMGIWGWELEWE